MATKRIIQALVAELSAASAKRISPEEIDGAVGEWVTGCKRLKTSDKDLGAAVEAYKRSQTGDRFNFPRWAAIAHHLGKAETVHERNQRTLRCDCDGDGFVCINDRTGYRMTKAQQQDGPGHVRPCWRCSPESFGSWHHLVIGEAWNGKKPSWHDDEIRRLQDAINHEKAAGTVTQDQARIELDRLTIGEKV